MEITVTTIDAGTIKPRWLAERAEIDLIVPPGARIQTPITVLHLSGALDGSSYETLLEVVQLVTSAPPRVILDFGEVGDISNSGLLGLFMAGSLLHGDPVHELDGYEVASRMRSAIESGHPLHHLHIAALSEDLLGILESTGFAALITIYDTVDEAISLFTSP